MHPTREGVRDIPTTFVVGHAVTRTTLQMSKGDASHSQKEEMAKSKGRQEVQVEVPYRDHLLLRHPRTPVPRGSSNSGNSSNSTNSSKRHRPKIPSRVGQEVLPGHRVIRMEVILHRHRPEEEEAEAPPHLDPDDIGDTPQVTPTPARRPRIVIRPRIGVTPRILSEKSVDLSESLSS